MFTRSQDMSHPVPCSHPSAPVHVHTPAPQDKPSSTCSHPSAPRHEASCTRSHPSAPVCVTDTTAYRWRQEAEGFQRRPADHPPLSVPAAHLSPLRVIPPPFAVSATFSKPSSSFPCVSTAGGICITACSADSVTHTQETVHRVGTASVARTKRAKRFRK